MLYMGYKVFFCVEQNRNVNLSFSFLFICQYLYQQEGYIGLFITLVPNVLKPHYLILQLKNLEYCNLTFLGLILDYQCTNFSSNILKSLLVIYLNLSSIVLSHKIPGYREIDRQRVRKGSKILTRDYGEMRGKVIENQRK